MKNWKARREYWMGKALKELRNLGGEAPDQEAMVMIIKKYFELGLADGCKATFR